MVEAVEALVGDVGAAVDTGALDAGPQHAGAVEAGAVDAGTVEAGADVVDDGVAVNMHRQVVSLNACRICISSMSRASNNIGCQGGSREKMWS